MWERIDMVNFHDHRYRNPIERWWQEISWWSKLKI